MYDVYIYIYVHYTILSYTKWPAATGDCRFMCAYARGDRVLYIILQPCALSSIDNNRVEYIVRRCSKMLPFTRCDFDVIANCCKGSIIQYTTLVSMYKRRARTIHCSCKILLYTYNIIVHTYYVIYIYIYNCCDALLFCTADKGRLQHFYWMLKYPFV